MRTKRGGEPPVKKQQAVKVTAKSPYSVSRSADTKTKLKGVELKDPNEKYTPEKANVEYESAIKGGKMVSIYDKSVDPTTRKLVLGSIGESDFLGKKTDIAIEKGYRARDYKDVYGVDFNPEEFRAASKGPNFDKYLKQKGISAGQSFVPKFGYQARYETEADRKKQKETEISDYLRSSKDLKLEISRMPQLKPGKIESKSKKLATGKIESTPIEKSDWQEPTGGVRTKTRIVKPYQVKAGEYIGQNIKYGLQKLAGKEPILRPGVKKTKEALIQGRVGKEASKAKAYFGAGFEGKSVSDIGEIQSSLKSSKSGLKAGIKEARKAGDREKVAAYKSAKKDVKSEIKQSKLASRYLKDLGQEYTGVKAGEKLARTGKVKAYTPEAMAGFIGSKQDVYDKNAYNDRFLAKKKKSASK